MMSIIEKSFTITGEDVVMKLKTVPLLFITACTLTSENPDPFRCFNEAMLEVNVSLDNNVLNPLSKVYGGITCEQVQTMLSNFLDNLKEPSYLVNYTLQLDGENMAISFFRFLVNSAVGMFGFFDIAELLGVPKHPTGYKNTLRKMEIPHGDYIMLPVFGASSTRDTIAEPFSWVVDPVTYFVGLPVAVSKAVFQMVVDRHENAKLIDSEMKDLEILYPKVRSVYLQKYGVKGNDLYSEEGPSPLNDD